MKRQAVILFLIAVLLASCAPPPGMVATLTLLPGTPTNRPPTPWPTITPRATNTLASVTGLTATETPIPPEQCPANMVDTSVPDDPSQLPGRHYNPNRLPQEFTPQDSGMLEAPPNYGWVHVKWQGRSVFWTQKLVCKDENARPYWEIVDVLALPRLDERYGEAMSTLCFYGERAVPFAVAYGMYDPTQPAGPQPGGLRGWKMNIQSAWEVQQEFAPLSLGGLNCVVQEKK